MLAFTRIDVMAAVRFGVQQPFPQEGSERQPQQKET